MAYEYTSYSGFGGTNGVVSEQSAQLVAEVFKKAGTVTESGNKYADRIRGKALQWVKGKVEQQMSAALPYINRAEQLAREGFQTYAQVKESIDRIRGGKITPDASGALNVIDAAGSAIQAVTRFGQTLGLSNRVVRQVGEWGGVATSCASMIASNYIAGAMGCALSVFGQLFGNLAQKPTRPDSPQTPMAYLVPVPQAMPFVAADATRLAQVLAHRYDVPSFRSMLAKLGPLADTQGIYAWLLGAYTPPPQYGDPSNVTDSVPAHTLRTLLNMLDFERGAAQVDANIRLGLQAIAGYREGAGEPFDKLAQRYDWYHDINIEAIELGSYFARAAIAHHGSPVAGVKMQCGAEHMSTYHPESTACKVGWFHDSWTGEVDFGPFLRLDELLNFFSAVGFVEYRRGEGRKAEEATGVGGNLVVQLRHVQDVRGTSAHYGRQCWTNLKRDDAHDLQNCASLVNHMRAGEVWAFKEIAAVRLLAAMSYVHLNWRWSDRSPAPGLVGDLISRVRGQVKDEFFELSLPIDPRQAEGRGRAWKQKPYGQPGKPQHYVNRKGSTTVWLTGIVPFSSGINGSWLAQRILDREALIGTLRAEPTPLKARTFSFDPNYQGTGGNIGTVLVLGAAALAAMKFLK